MDLPANWRPAVIFFDLDDTLIPEGGTDAAVVDEVAGSVLADHQLAPGALVSAVRIAAENLWQRSGEHAYCRRIGTSAMEGLSGDYAGDDPHLQALQKFIRETVYRERAWTIALQSLGVDDASLARALAAAYAETRRSRHVPYPDALPALRRLAPAFRLALITNGAPRIQRPKLEGSGLANFFDPVIVSGEFGVGKPDPAIFHQALGKASASVESALMVGNSLASDVAGARNAGIRAVWVNRTGEACPGEIEPDLTVTTLDEIYPRS